MGNRIHNRHFILDINNKKEIYSHQFTDYRGVVGFNFIHLKKRKKLLYMGGSDYDRRETIDGIINIFDLNTYK